MHTYNEIACYLVEIDHIVLFIDHPTTCDFAEMISHKELRIVQCVALDKSLFLRRDQQHALFEEEEKNV